MKRLLLGILVLAFVSCDKNDDNTTGTSSTEVRNTLIAGTWRVTYYWDTDHDETANFSSYNFTFLNSGTVNATSSILTATGNWATGVDDSKVKLTLSFTSPADFAEISDDWHVIERTATKVRLQDVSGGGGGTDYLTFEKN